MSVVYEWESQANPCSRWQGAYRLFKIKLRPLLRRLFTCSTLIIKCLGLRPTFLEFTTNDKGIGASAATQEIR